MRLIRLVPLLLMVLALLKPAAAVPPFPADYEFEAEGCGMHQGVLMFWAPFVICFMGLWHRLIDQLLYGLAHGKAAPKRSALKRTDKLAYMATSLCLVAAVMLVSSPSVPNDAVDLGSTGLPFIWAAVFSPWFLIRHWGAAREGRFTPIRSLLLAFGAIGAFGWLYLVSPWL